MQSIAMSYVRSARALNVTVESHFKLDRSDSHSESHDNFLDLAFHFLVYRYHSSSWTFLRFKGALDACHCLFLGLTKGSIRMGLLWLRDRYEVHFAATGIRSSCTESLG